jgi:penicillin-binding protein 1A
MSEEEAYLTTSLLRGVVDHGTGQRARAVGRPVAGKTGTTNKNRDAWFVGYSTDFVAGCWTGYDDSLPLGSGEYGAVAALPAWVDFMKFAHQERPRTQFPRPAGIVTAWIDPRTGLLPYPEQQDAVEEEFLGDTLPTTEASPPAVDLEAVEGADTSPGADHEAVPGDQGEATPATPAEPSGDAAAQPPGEPTGAAENNEATRGSATLPEAEPPPF